MSYRKIDEIKFETQEKHKKGIATEDAALRIVASAVKSLKAEAIQRVIPPVRSMVDECDAIILTDSCVMILEVKRIGGNITDFSLDKETLSVEKGKQVERIPNPVLRLREKTTALSKYIQQDAEWVKLNSLFRVAGIFYYVPVIPVLCFGPSTGYSYEEPKDDFVVCSTRTLKRSLSKFLEGKKSVIGAYRSAKQIVTSWQIAGKLTVKPIAGFIRAVPMKAFGKIVVFEDVMSIEGRNNGHVSITYRDKVRKISKEIRQIVFKVNTNGHWEDVTVDAGRTFSWRAGG